MKKVNARELGKWIDLTQARVGQLAKKGVFERDNENLYDLRLTILAYIEHLRKHSVEHVNLQMTAAEARNRKLIAEATLAEIEMNLKKGLLCHVADVLPQWERMIVAFKTKLLAMPSKVAPVLYEKKSIAQISDIIKREIIEALNELEVDGIEIVADSEDGEEVSKDASRSPTSEN